MKKQKIMRFSLSLFLLLLSILLSLGGIVAFIVLFVPDFNIFWMFLSPIIIIFYQTPAVFCFRQYKKQRRKELGKKESQEKSNETLHH
ncbi:MAG: hypothetical protein KJ727_01310 [Acidobacteria bacterium]|nr:hypothetical protein [Acidobacteriota bacterium]MBU4330072.1 hypothetical protein [Acidobacteriota bacterium]MCG2814389.1 hypothetical protein [Candidatus Aminicenantes bacterium]